MERSHSMSGWQITFLFAALFFFGVSMQTFAQGRTVKGTVTAADDNSALPGVNVVVKGTSTGTITDPNGGFTLSVPGDNATLVFSFIGYTTEEVAVGSRTTIDIKLAPDIQSLQEVVVTGYSTENRRDVTGAVATVKSRELVAVPSGNVEQQLQGRVPGVTVITNGQPGTTSVVRLRGFGAFGGNEPLYVVDGVPVTNTDFLNPDDIETTTVLKDAASASIYGARAANGVIVYTTRKGSESKMRVSYDGVFGVTMPGKVENILNPQEQADWIWQAKRNTATQLGLTPGSQAYNDLFKTDQFGSDPNGPVLPDYLMVGTQFGLPASAVNLEAERAKYNNDPRLGAVYLVMPANKAGTNWWDAITRPALLNRHTLGFSGGNDRSKYYVSLGMQNQQGVLIHQKFERYALRVNSEHKIVKGVRFGQTLQGTYLRRQGLTGAEGGRGAANEENNFLDAFRMPAIIPVYDAFGGYAGTQAKGFNNPRNPVAARDRAKGNGPFGFGVFGNFYVEVDPIKDLTLRSSIGGGLSSSYGKNYNLPSYENSENQSTYSYNEFGSYSFNWVFTNTARYNKKFGIHSIDLLGGIESLNTGTGRNINGTGQSPFSRDPNYVNLTTTGNRVVNSGYFNGVNFFSVFGQAKYIFNDKYILTGVLRRDGASSFGPENRYGVFPAVSAAWRISSESFMASVPFVTDLKLRGGYGMMGNTAGLRSDNQFSLYQADLGSSFYDIGGGNAAPTSGFYRSRIGNPAAKWETSITSNIGLDGSFLDGKLDVVVDFWRKDTKDLLYTLETAAVVGPQAADPAVNIAKMRNQGIDIELTTRGTRGESFNYEVKLTGSFLHNEIVELAPGVPYFDSPAFRGIIPIRNQIGRSISAYYGYDVVGLFQNQEEVNAAPTQDGKAVGRFRYRDINGDGAITIDDRTYLGSPVPKFNGGINVVLGYKNLELTAFLQTFLGVQNYNFSKWYNNFYPSFTGTAYSTAVKESFTFERGGNTVPIFEDASNFSTNTQSNSFYVENGNYARLTNLQLAYKLPNNLLDRFGFERARVYLQSTNLFTISKYSGLDPGVAGAADTTLGIDVGNAPITRGYNIGLNLTF
ncbi:TonB-dependent receptor [Rhodocytophaga rosea]|uniref:TonB-dependent receptor n=2 Tax=Rhodocytophaga rosea TaxID=2704465 RepID=A0A6C0GV10_9BACT|nr:TonB-dependent receptor [Rhodocytophaga rosea]